MQADDVMDFISRFPGKDDDELSRALKIYPRQQVNQICRKLEKARKIRREIGARGKIVNMPLGSVIQTAPPREMPAPEEAKNVRDEWYWEGNVSDSLVHRLVSEGWEILSQADTASRQRGIDIVASRGANETILIEVKGFPSKSYADPARAGKMKKTNPNTQARHWFSRALYTAMRMRANDPQARVAMAFPAFDLYRGMASELIAQLRLLSVEVIFVAEDGSVTVQK